MSDFTVKAAAEKVGVSTALVYRWCRSGRLTHSRLPGGAIHISSADLDAFLASYRQKKEKEYHDYFVLQSCQTGHYWTGSDWSADRAAALRFGFELPDPWAAAWKLLLELRPIHGPMGVTSFSPTTKV